MPRDGNEKLDGAGVPPMLQLAVLNLWAAAMQVERNFSRREIEALPELSRTIQAAHLLPAAIGWDDVLTEQMTEPFLVA